MHDLSPARTGGSGSETGGRRGASAGPAPLAQRHQVLRVHFTSAQEFVCELKAAGPDVEPVVRLTFRSRRDPEGPPRRHLSVVAGYLRQARPGVLVLYELVHYAGEVWDGLDESLSAQTFARASRAYDAVARAADEQSIRRAAGVYAVPGDRDAAA